MANPHAPTPPPTSITLHQHSRVLEIAFSGSDTLRIPFELMRVYSPSAEVRGHGGGQAVLQSGKRDVGIAQLVAVGNYAVQAFFSDGHNSGIFTWDYLYFLGSQQTKLWLEYEERLHQAGASRDAQSPTPNRSTL
jgi:DUF971 family protein